MKKILFTLSFSMLVLSSCSNENMAASNIEAMKSPEMENFDRAMKSLNNPENKPTEEEKRSGSAELSDRRKRVLLPSAMDLIKSTGVTDAQIQQKTNGDISAILVWAIQINQEKVAQIRSNAKL
ncbi:hypothetical protein [Chryseobacterium indoltheticum]|uniref:hypothetical protein n=1 Tax=Chryseobacterium indoltheticum TaxID=254 RepID=UPI003F49B06A